jgi:hypothetical protein
MITSGNPSKALKYRQNAASCDLLAASTQLTHDRDLLLRMQESLLSRADHEDWLEGLPPAPPAQSLALAVPRPIAIGNFAVPQSALAAPIRGPRGAKYGCL